MTLRPDIFPRRWILFFGGKRSKKHPTITITEFVGLIREWLSA
jgi:hypothetical protein